MQSATADDVRFPAFLAKGVEPNSSFTTLALNLELLDGMSSSVSSIHALPLVTVHVRRFDGDWQWLLENRWSTLYSTFVSEAAAACDVRKEDIGYVDFRLGSLYVTFHVSHDADISESEIQERVEMYPFREMLRLYNNRDAPQSGLDAALKRIRELEEEMKRSLEKLRDESDRCIADLKHEMAQREEALKQQMEARERELLEALSKAQGALCEQQSENKRLAEEKEKTLETLKRERERLHKHALRQSELIAAIVQENKKEMEAKEREFEENLHAKDVIIENLRGRLRSRSEQPNGESLSRGVSVDPERAEEFSKLMGRMEDITMVLEKSQEAESEARAEIQRLSEALRFSEEARQADSVIYENNVLALKQQLQAYRDTKLAEDHQKRHEESRARRGVDHSRDEKTNETIVRQYETSLENIIGTLQDRLAILREEYCSFLRVSEEETISERGALNEHEEDNQRVRQTFRTASLILQRVFWSTREEEVPVVIKELENAVASAEKSRATVKVTLALLESRLKSFNEQKEWMDTHQQSLEELITSLRHLNKRAFERQLTLMNGEWT